MIFQDQPIFSQCFGLADERTRRLNDLIDSAFDVLGSVPSFTTSDICKILAPNIQTTEEGFYVAWVTYQTLTEAFKSKA